MRGGASNKVVGISRSMAGAAPATCGDPACCNDHLAEKGFEATLSVSPQDFSAQSKPHMKHPQLANSDVHKVFCQCLKEGLMTLKPKLLLIGELIIHPRNALPWALDPRLLSI